jgi:hypothetical protein
MLKPLANRNRNFETIEDLDQEVAKCYVALIEQRFASLQGEIVDRDREIAKAELKK